MKGSKDGRDKADDALHDALRHRALVPLAECEFGAFLHVGKEDVAHASVHPLVVDDKAALEVVLEAAVIEIGGTGYDDVVVNDDTFGVEHSGIVVVYLDSGAETLRDVGMPRELEHSGIALTGNHDAHINFGKRRGL